MSKVILLLFLATTALAQEQSSSPSSTTVASNQPQKPAVIAVDPPVDHSAQKRDYNAPQAPAADQGPLLSTFKPEPADRPSQPSNSSPHGDTVACAQIYEPVCGSNGQTYSNSCTLQLAQKTDPTLTLAKKGEC